MKDIAKEKHKQKSLEEVKAESLKYENLKISKIKFIIIKIILIFTDLKDGMNHLKNLLLTIQNFSMKMPVKFLVYQFGK